MRRCQVDKPYLKDLFYIRGIMRHRMYVNEPDAIKLLEQAYLAGVEITVLKDLVFEVRNWTEWRERMEFLILEG